MEEAERHLLKKFLDGLCTGDELKRVITILDGQEGRELLDELMRKRETQAWNHPAVADRDMQELVRGKQAEMQQRIAAHESQQRSFSGKKVVIRWSKPLRYAAIWAGVLILGGLAVWQFKKNRIPVMAEVHYVEKVNQHGIPERYTLPDSTVVYLAAGSTLMYPETYPATGRDVHLLGEAFFDVTRDESHPFTVLSGEMKTRVLGTSFRVTAFEDHEQEVAVATGKVSVSSVDGEKTTGLALLTPGLKVTYNAQTGRAVKGKVDVYNLEQWKAGELIIDEQPMSVVARELERRYDIQLTFSDPEAANNRVSGAFSATEPVSNVLDMLGFVGKFRHESRDGKTFTIYKTE